MSVRIQGFSMAFFCRLVLFLSYSPLNGRHFFFLSLFYFDIESSGQMSLLYKLQLAVVVAAATIATLQTETLWHHLRWHCRRRHRRVLSIATVTQHPFIHCHSLHFIYVRFTKYRIYPGLSLASFHVFSFIRT